MRFLGGALLDLLFVIAMTWVCGMVVMAITEGALQLAQMWGF